MGVQRERITLFASHMNKLDAILSRKSEVINDEYSNYSQLTATNTNSQPRVKVRVAATPTYATIISGNNIGVDQLSQSPDTRVLCETGS